MRQLRLVVLLSATACGNGERIQAYPENFVGVGLELTIQDDYPVVVRILPGGSAESAGVEPGDKVMLIDDKNTHGITLGNAVMLIRGKPGSQVRLTLERGATRIVAVVPRRAMKKGGADYHAVQ